MPPGIPPRRRPDPYRGAAPMSQNSRAAEAGFSDLVAALGQRSGVTCPGGPAGTAPRFGSSALRVHDRIFAMVSHGRLVLKLPRQRVADLIASGDGGPFDAGKGRPMKEWVSLDPARQDSWLELAAEAMEFVGSMR